MAKRLGKKTINKIHQLRSEGKSGPAIAELVKRSLPTIYKVLSTRPSTNGSPKPRKGRGLSEIEKIVRREVQNRLKHARQAALKAFSKALAV